MSIPRARLGLVLLLVVGCSSATVPDAGSTDAVASRPDAIGGSDAVVMARDTGETIDATAAADAGVGDADPPRPDTGPGDTGAGDAAPVDPCGPVDLARGPARFTEALGAWLGRCNPELTPNEVLSISGFISFVSAPAFENTTLVYDSTAAGQCGCAIAAAPCDALAWFRAIDACDATFVSTATTGDPCSTDFDCPSRHRCAERQKDVAFGGRAPPLSCGRGVCERFARIGEACPGPVACAPGSYCDTSALAPVCAADAIVGDSCADRPCIGDVDDVLILPPNQCFSTKGASTCLARGRAAGTCDQVECHGLYRCDNNLACQLIPGEGDACIIPFEPNPSLIARELMIHEATFACRGNIGVGLGASTYCTQTSTTTGAAVCRTRPLLGQPCGIGADLAPFCTPDAYCRDIDPQTLAPVTSVCVLRRTETSTCGGRRFSTFAPNQECEPGTTCTFDVGSGESRCADECGGGVN